MPALPEVHVLGDSISMHYGPYLKAYLAPRFAYSRKGEGQAAADLNVVSDVNGGDSDACLAYLRAFVAAGLRPAILLWNCGLHDIKTTDAGYQVPPERYADNLRAGVELLRSHGIHPVWVRTTAAFEEIHNVRMKQFRRFHNDVIVYNDLADGVMRAAGVPTVDLYGFTLTFGADACEDHVHFTDEVRRLQAAFIAGRLYPFAEPADGTF